MGIKGITLGKALGNIAAEVGFTPKGCPESDRDLHIGTVCAPGSAYSVALEDCYISSLHFWNGGSRGADPPLDSALYRASLTCPSSGFEYVEEALSKKFGSSPTPEQGESFMRWVWKFRDDKVVYLSRLGRSGSNWSNKFTIGLIDYRLQQAYKNYREAVCAWGETRISN